MFKSRFVSFKNGKSEVSSCFASSIARIITCFCLTIFSTSLYAGKIWTKFLEFPEKSNSLRALALSVAGVHVLEDRLVVLVNENGFFAITPFKFAGKTREDKFGKITDSKRFKTHARSDRFFGVDHLPGKFLFMDGARLYLSIYDDKEMTPVSHRSIAWDLVRPAPDSRGEPAGPEIAKLRAKFKKMFRKSGDLKLSGLAPTQAKLKRSNEYFLSSRIEGFPLLKMKCSKEDPNQCVISRKCNIEGKTPVSESITGIAYYAKKKRILIGDRLRKTIQVFRYSSCFHVTKVGEIKLPPKMKELSNIHIDKNENLWLTTRGADDYHNASVYFWEKSKWL